MRILVTYHSVTGSTAEVAEAIASTIPRGHDVDCRSIDTVTDIGGYDSCVIGSPIHGFAIKSEVVQFLEKHRDVLQTKRIAYFALGLCVGQCRGFFQNLNEKALQKANDIVPAVDSRLFAGRTDQRLPTLPRVLFGIAKDAPLDRIDRTAIEQWARDIAIILTE